MRARPTESQIEPGIPSLGDGMSLGSDYGLTSEEREAKKQQREAEHAAKSDKKAAHKALKDSDKAKLRAWQQAAQLGLRFDPARGKWYREVKISGALPQPAPASKKTPLLALGAKGADVKRAQKLLNESGFACGNDGVFSESMKKQVMNFQKSEGLRVDGKIGKETWEALDNDMAAPASSSTGQVVRQYQDGAVAIMKGTLPPGAAHGAVLSPSKFGPTVAAIKADVDENYDVFPLPDLTPPPANWDFKLGKMKPGFTLDVDKLSSTLKTVAGRFQPSGKAAQASETFEMAETEVPADSSKKWMIAGGITVALLVTGGLYLAFRKEPENVAKTPKPSQSTEAE
jgi:peptidoglycan hydrolase-like protein with peptidoglycan-binding domain